MARKRELPPIITVRKGKERPIVGTLLSKLISKENPEMPKERVRTRRINLFSALKEHPHFKRLVEAVQPPGRRIATYYVKQEQEFTELALQALRHPNGVRGILPKKRKKRRARTKPQMPEYSFRDHLDITARQVLHETYGYNLTSQELTEATNEFIQIHENDPRIEAYRKSPGRYLPERDPLRGIIRSIAIEEATKMEEELRRIAENPQAS